MFFIQAAVYLVAMFLAAGCMLFAAKLSFVHLEMKQAMLILLLSSPFGFIGYVGFPLSLVVGIFLLMRLTGCSAYDAAAIVGFSHLFFIASALIVFYALESFFALAL